MDVSFGRKALRAFKIARAYLYYALPHRSHRKPFHWRMPEDVIWSWLGSGSGPVWATAKNPAILNTYWTDISLWKLMEIDGNWRKIIYYISFQTYFLESLKAALIHFDFRVHRCVIICSPAYCIPSALQISTATYWCRTSMQLSCSCL